MNYQPSLEQVLETARRGDNNLIPIYQDVPADLETPVSAFLKVARGEHSFLLESVEGGERLARYSFIGTEPYRVYKSGPFADPTDGVDPLIEIEQEMSRYKLSHPKDSEARTSLPRFTGGAVGFLAYDVRRATSSRESRTRRKTRPGSRKRPVHVRRSATGLRSRQAFVVKVVAHCRSYDGDVEALVPASLLEDRRAGQGSLNHDRRRPAPTRRALPYEHAEPESNVRPRSLHRNGRSAKGVHRGKRHHQVFQAGRSAVPRRRRRRYTVLDLPRAAKRQSTRRRYMYYLQMTATRTLSARQPEMIVRVEDGVVEMHPIARDDARAKRDPDETAGRSSDSSLADEKERTEHVMLVDLGRSDIGRRKRAGDGQGEGRHGHRALLARDAPRLARRRKAERRDVGLLRRAARLVPGRDAGSAPKIRAMEIIGELEPGGRGPYGGA